MHLRAGLRNGLTVDEIREVILQSAIYAPDIIVATGNGWWTSGTSIIAIQQASAGAWAQLFGVPIVMAFNRSAQE